jgi:hypothetical protein
MYTKVMDDNSLQSKKISISDIQNADFTENTEPKDERLLELLKLAYTKKIYCRTALVPLENVIPFSDFIPNVSDDYLKYFKEKYAAGRPPGMLVYQSDDCKFVMSDDYNAYFMYRHMGAQNAICQILDAENEPYDVIEASEPYYMDLPVVEQIN